MAGRGSVAGVTQLINLPDELDRLGDPPRRGHAPTFTQPVTEPGGKIGWGTWAGGARPIPSRP